MLDLVGIWRCMMFKNILVGVDGSEYSYKAAKIAGEIARCMAADLFVVSCFEPVPAYLGEPNLQKAITNHISEAEAVMKTALNEIGSIDGELHSELIEGAPADTILAVAEVRSVDLIVMGTRGLGRLSGFVLGSQSQKVVAQANCPVMLVH
jgi:nucleotide-binding universal stress UspA family protein